MKKTIFCFAILVSFITAFCFAEKTPVENLYRYRLDNGLELFVAENHIAPIAYIEVAVRAGGVAQTRENAGLFHLYEHMMFKGNSLYADAASVTNALSKMGVSNWNGSTGVQCVNYYFTVPSKVLRTGIEFWSSALREPLMDPDEFENEKQVVLSEIEGKKNDPGVVLYHKLTGWMFPDAPWKMDPSGLSETVSGATVEDLKAIQAKYYVPCNSALFIGGDVNPEEVYEMVKQVWGDWKSAPDPWAGDSFKQNPAPFKRAVYKVIPYAKIAPHMAQVCVELRGPDMDFDVKSTYGADVLNLLLDEPDGIYKQAMLSVPELKIANADHIGNGYSTTRKSGTQTFSAVLMDPDSDDMPQRVRKFAFTLQKDVIRKISMDKNIFTEEQFRKVAQKVRDDRVYDTQTAQGLLSAVRSSWVDGDADYFFNYVSNMEKCTYDEVNAYIFKYITAKNPLVYVLVNPDVYEKTKARYKANGFELAE